ncbi:MAG: hypothetical protein R6U98_20215 [Pirellulaceae bacterium]
MTPPKVPVISTLLLAWCLTAPWGHGQTTGGAPRPNGVSSTSGARLPLHATQKREFAIPFSVDDRVAQAVEVHLYVSVDEGKNWQLHSRQPPNARHFVFRASRDGEYWFASRTLDGARRSQPSTSLTPELRVIVDTAAPQVELNARAGKAGHVLTSWRVFDPNLLASSLKLEYQEDAGEPWKPVAVQSPQDEGGRTTYQGELEWKPEIQSSTLNVRAEVKDRAGNLGVANRRLLLPAQTPPSTFGDTSQNGLPSDPFSRHGQPSEGAVPWPSEYQAGRIASGHRGFQTPDSDQMGAPGTRPSAGGRNAPAAGNPASHATSTRESVSRGTASGSAQTPSPPQAEGYSDGAFAPERNVPMQQAATRFATPPGPATSESPGSASKPAGESEQNDVRSEDAGAQPQRDSAAHGGAARGVTPGENPSNAPENVAPENVAPENVADRLPAGERPQMTNSRRFQLEYDVAATGSSGVAEVQLWATADAGRTWRLWGTDEDRESPFDVAVEKDGIFGFHVVVVGNNGMSGRRPRAGDPADIWIGVDTTPPTGELTGATYGEGPRAGKLLIQWRASDSFLASQPITLYYSEAADGPWTTIVSSLPNTGEFAWSAGPKLPGEVYLKLEVRDQAGNTCSARTDQPVSIAELAPKARIRGIQRVQDMDREAFRIPRRR